MADKPRDESRVDVVVERKCLKDVWEVERDDGYELTVTEDSLMRLHGLSLTLPLPCDLCPIGTVFDDLDEFDAHMSEHPEAKMFACQLCSNTYKSWSNLVAHRKMFHYGKVLSCERCSKRKSHSRLEGSVDYPVSGKPHGCEECEIGLNNLSDVYRHYYFHKAPPGCSRRRTVNHFGAAKRKWTGEVENVARDQSGSSDLSGTQNATGNQAANMSGSSRVKLSQSLIENLALDPCNGVRGNLIVCSSGNVASAAGGTQTLPEIQNGKVIGNVISIQSGCLVADGPGVKSGNLIVKPATSQGKVVKWKSGKEGILLMKPAEILGGDVPVNPVGIQSSDSSVEPSRLQSVKIPGNLPSIQMGIMPGSVTVTQSHGSAVSPTVTQGGISNSNLPENPSNIQNETPPIIISEVMSLAEGSKSNIEEMDINSGTVEERGELRLLAPKGGLENISDQLDDGMSNQINLEVDEVTINHNHFCPHCNFSCVKLEEYRNHLISVETGHDCIMCSGSQFKKVTLIDHEYCQPQTQQFKCILCMIILESEKEFVLHLMEKHAASYLPCCLCGRKFNWIVYIEHVKTCQQKCIEWELRRQMSWKACEICGKVFHSTRALRRHIKRHVVNGKLNHDCQACGRTFQHGGAYAKHLWANPTHGPLEQRAKIPGKKTNYICEKCGKTFSKRDGLQCHLMRHADVKPYACTSCPKSFITRRSLVVHVRQHTGERPYMCEVCGKNFTGPTSLYVHQRKHRADDGKGGAVQAAKAVKKPSVKHTCPICGKMLSSKLIFEGHMRQHSGERPFVCEICGRGFTTAKILRLHVKRHEKDPPAKKVQRVRWVPDVLGVASKTVVEIEGAFECNSSSTCIFLCPRCGLGLVSPDELEDHLSNGSCPGGGAEIVLPLSNESEVIGMESMVDVVQCESS